jgi:hypothetical protein
MARIGSGAGISVGGQQYPLSNRVLQSNVVKKSLGGFVFMLV